MFRKWSARQFRFGGPRAAGVEKNPGFEKNIFCLHARDNDDFEEGSFSVPACCNEDFIAASSLPLPLATLPAPLDCRGLHGDSGSQIM